MDKEEGRKGYGQREESEVERKGGGEVREEGHGGALTDQ